jgi:ABC-type uncharacterized transport system ATPase subunit
MIIHLAWRNFSHYGSLRYTNIIIGSGKTTLLNAITGRIEPSKSVTLSGKVKYILKKVMINDEKFDIQKNSRICALVLQ